MLDDIWEEERFQTLTISVNTSKDSMSLAQASININKCVCVNTDMVAHQHWIQVLWHYLFTPKIVIMSIDIDW